LVKASHSGLEERECILARTGYQLYPSNADAEIVPDDAAPIRGQAPAH
jgi:hypothetical protein